MPLRGLVRDPLTGAARSRLLHTRAVLGHNVTPRSLRRRQGDVADHGLASIVSATILGPAGRHVHPFHGLRAVPPVRDPQAHARLHNIAQGGQVVPAATPMRQHHLVVLLPQGRAHAKQVPAVLNEACLHCEGVAGVDPVPPRRAVGAVLVVRVLGAAAAVATGVVTVLGRPAAVGRGLECVVVRLHEVDFRAPLPTDVVGVAIVRRLEAAILAPAVLAVPAASRRRDEVDGHITRAADMA
mmetsp:Transcript_105534/g.303493  ORF Transcript_105534/g.303493 Transcript_105534/m.303493 type:complete len:241 (+) Transcript_105534:502-1224(+)